MHLFSLGLIFCVFHQLGLFCFMLFELIMLDLVSSVPSQEIGWEERLQNGLFCVKWLNQLYASCATLWCQPVSWSLVGWMSVIDLIMRHFWATDRLSCAVHILCCVLVVFAGNIASQMSGLALSKFLKSDLNKVCWKLDVYSKTRKARQYIGHIGCSTTAPIAIDCVDCHIVPQLRLCSNRPHKWTDHATGMHL